MFKPALTAAAALAAIAACQSAPAQEPAQPEIQQAETQPVTPPPEEVDLFSFAIETGRWNAMIDNAREGVRLAPYPDGEEDLVLRSDLSLKEGALDLIRLQREACSKGLVTGADCDQVDVPEWATEPPTADADIGELIQRSQWLGEALQAFHSVGCAAGQDSTGEERFCAVE